MKEYENDILFVLVIYGCRLEDSKAFLTLISSHEEEIGNVFVYDNSPFIQKTDLPVAEYVHDTDNGGLSKAYNTACKYAAEHNYKWLLLMDQDTSFPNDAMQSYKKASRVKDFEMIVPRHCISTGQYISPTHYRMKISDLQDNAPVGEVLFKDAAPINSGMMLTVDSFIKSGGYEESVWLDFSDVCFIERYKKHFHSFYVMPDVVCTQAFSAVENDESKTYERFCIYLECARNFPKRTIKDAVEMLITTLRPTVSRTIKKKSSRYFIAYWYIYVLGNKHNWESK